MMTAAVSSPLEVPVAAVRVAVQVKWCKGLVVVDVLPVVVRLALVVLVSLRLAVLLQCWLWMVLFAWCRNNVDNLGAT